MKGCVLWLVLLALGVGILSAGVISLENPASDTLNPGGMVEVHTVRGVKEKPAGLIGAWIAMGVAVLFVAAQVIRSVPGAKAAGIPGTGCAEGLAVIAVGIVLIVFLVAGALATLGGG